MKSCAFTALSGLACQVESERTVRELQHISAGAINETARLVDYVGRAPPTSSAALPPSSTPWGGGSTGVASPLPASLRPIPGVSSVQRVPRTLDYTSATAAGSSAAVVQVQIQQHASQIHKLIAGLDFLEQHIIRQDQVIDAMQKHVRASALGPTPVVPRPLDPCTSHP